MSEIGKFPIDEPFPHKLIICSHKNFKKVSERFKTKKVIADIYCDDKFATYIRKYPRGVFNIKVDDWSVWVPSEFPYFEKLRK